MIDNPKQWLAGVPWDSVVTINKALCQAQKLEPGTKPGACERIREKWESAVGCRALLLDVLDLCRECNEAMPFTFNNAARRGPDCPYHRGPLRGWTGEPQGIDAGPASLQQGATARHRDGFAQDEHQHGDAPTSSATRRIVARTQD